MTRLTTLILAGVLFVAAPVATAPAQAPPIAQAEQNNDNGDDDDFPWGLLGLLGLAGLAGLRKRDDHRDVPRTTGGTTGR